MRVDKQIKINLELNIVGDGRIFLNFWNYKNGEDVITEVVNNELYIGDKRITLQEFIEKIKL